MTIPREGGYLCRFYVELDLLGKDKRAKDVKLTEQDLIAKAQKIFHPYTLDVKEVAWWSIYEVGQRIAERLIIAQRGVQRILFLVHLLPATLVTRTAPKAAGV